MKRSSTIVVRLILTLACLGLLFSQVPFQAVLTELKSAKLHLVVVAYLLLFVTRFLVAARTWLLALAQGLPVSLLKSYQITLAASFYGLFLPGGSSAIVKWYKLAGAGGGRIASFSTLVADRLVDTALIALVGSTFVVLDLTGQTTLLSRADAIIIMAGTSLAYVLLFTNVTYRAGEALLSAVPLPDLLAAKVSRLVQSMRRFAELTFKQHAGIAALSVSRELIGVSQAYLLAMALALPLDLITVVWLRALAFLVSLLPVTINGLGLREGAFALLLLPYGISAQASVAYALSLLGGTVFIGCAGGLIELHSLWRVRFRRQFT